MKTVKPTEHHQKVRRASVPSRQRRNTDRPLALVLAGRDAIDRYTTPFDGIERSTIAYAAALDRALCEPRPAQVRVLGPQARVVAARLAQAGHDAGVITLPGGMDARPRKPTRSDKRWQALVAVDCLEHVQDPVRFLERLKPLLAPEGRLIVVVPNIRHASVRLSMLLGRYPAVDNGHANGTGRPLSASSAEQLLNSAGFLVSGIERQMDTRETLEELAQGLPEAVLNVLASDQDALTSHFVLIAQPVGPSVLGALQRRVNERLGDLERLAPTSDRQHELERILQRIADLHESLHQSADEQRAAVASEFRRLEAQTRARDESLQAAREGLLARAAELRSLTAQVERAQYRGVIARLREMVNGNVPKNAKVLVISRGDEELVRFDQRRGLHFPQAESGVYAGHHPAHSRAAITHLEALRQRGARYLVVPRTAFWWFEHYGEFAQHLRTRYRCLVNHESTGMLFALETRRE